MNARILSSLGAILVPGMAAAAPAAAEPLKALFLGDNGHHRPAERFAQLQPVLASHGVELVYTDKLVDLDPRVLGAYDALVVYGNIDTLPCSRRLMNLGWQARRSWSSPATTDWPWGSTA